MYHSFEIRWFFQSDITPFLNWFGGENPASRTDHYLKKLGANINVKLREGRIEVKHRIDLPRVIEVNAGITGKIEEWVKWSFGLEENPGALDFPVDHPEYWLAVSKKRWRRHFQVENGKIVEQAMPSFSHTHCAAELTEVTAEGQDWLSIDLEASGRPSNLVDTLKLTTRYFFNAQFPAKLVLPHSAGYPEWFTKLKDY